MQLVVVHGGANGEIKFHDGTITKAYEETLETLQSIDLGENQIMPTLADVFDLVGGSLIVNVEIKAPFDE